MPVDRKDHFAGMRSEEILTEVPADAPHVSPELVAYLDAVGFGRVTINAGSFPGSRDHEISVTHAVTYAGGQLSVLQHLRTLIRSH